MLSPRQRRRPAPKGSSDWFKETAAWCLTNGNLTIADLAHWLERPYQTVHQWVMRGCEPRGPQGKHAKLRMGLLVHAITHEFGFPLDPHESSYLRPGTIERIRNELERAGLPARDPA